MGDCIERAESLGQRRPLDSHKSTSIRQLTDRFTKWASKKLVERSREKLAKASRDALDKLTDQF
jgi:hypothetical protein